MDETGSVISYGWAGLGWHILPGGRLYEDVSAGPNYKWIDLPGAGRERAYLLSGADEPYFREDTDADAFPNQEAGDLWMTSSFTFIYPSGEKNVGGTNYQTYSAITTGGIVYEFVEILDTDSEGWTYGSRIYNAYGDEVTISYASVGPAGALEEVCDAQSRCVSFALDSSNYLESATWLDSNGAPAEITYDINADSASRYQLDSVSQPTGEVTSYGYYDGLTDLWDGALEIISLPTGGTQSYSYEAIDFLWDYDAGLGEITYTTLALSSKTHSPDLSDSYVWLYDYEAISTTSLSGSVFNEQTTTVTLPTLDTIEHSYYAYDYVISGLSLTETPRHAIGLPLHTKWFDASTSIPREWVEYAYAYDVGGTTYNNELEIASIGVEPFVPGTVDTPKRFLPYLTSNIADSNNGNHVYRQALSGTVSSDYDDYANSRRLSRAQTNPYSSLVIGSVYPEDHTEWTWAWESTAAGADTLAGWNQVRLPESMATGQYDGSSGISVTYNEEDYTYETASGSEGWIQSVDRISHPVSHGSADEYTNFTYSISSSDTVVSDTVVVTIDHGGQRTEERTYTDGALVEQAWVDGGSAVTAFTQTVDANTGLVKTRVDANGDTTRYTYDALARLTRVRLPADDDFLAAYNLTASPPRVIESRGIGPDSSRTTTTYDGLGRIASVETDIGAAMTSVAEVELDGLGRTTKTFLPYEGGSLAGAGSYTQTTYDVLDRVTDIDRYDASSLSTESASKSWYRNTVTRTNFRGHTTTSYLDGRGNEAFVTPPAGSKVESLHFGSGYNGPVIWVRDSSGGLIHQQLRAVDGAGRLRWFYDYQSGSRYFLYDAAGELEYEYDDNGDYIVHEYDFRGRVDTTSLTTSASPLATPTYDYIYDGDSISGAPGLPFTSLNPEGRLTGVTDPAGGERFSYDNQGRVVRQQRWFSGFGSSSFVATLEYDYDSEGNLAGVTLKDGGNSRSLDYSYGPGHKVTGDATTPALVLTRGTSTDTLVETVSYHPEGAFDTLELGNTVDHLFDVDGLGRPDRVYTSGALSGGVAADLDLTYTYDGNNNVETISDGCGSLAAQV